MMLLNQDSEYSHLFKIIMLGDSGVGKTNILSRFTRNQFNLDSKPTIGIEFSVKNIALADKIVKMQLWDTAGQERYQAITKAYYKGALGAIVVFDLTQIVTLHNTKRWFDELVQHGDPNVVKLLVGNKSDLNQQRVVTQEEAADVAIQYGSGYIETSALNLDNIQEAYEIIGSEIFKIHGQSLIKQQIESLDSEAIITTYNNKITKKKQGCC